VGPRSGTRGDGRRRLTKAPHNEGGGAGWGDTPRAARAAAAWEGEGEGGGGPHSDGGPRRRHPPRHTGPMGRRRLQNDLRFELALVPYLVYNLFWMTVYRVTLACFLTPTRRMS